MTSAEQRQSNFEERLTGDITNILLLCRVSDDASSIHANVTQHSGGSIQEIISTALHFHRIAGEDIISRELDPFIACPALSFNASIMVDDNEDARHASGTSKQSVLCTTQMGLQREIGSKGMVEKVFLLKARVVLESILDELAREDDN